MFLLIIILEISSLLHKSSNTNTNGTSYTYDDTHTNETDNSDTHNTNENTYEKEGTNHNTKYDK